MSCQVYSCPHKGDNLAGIDPDTGEIIPLFKPRRRSWEEHFRLSGAWVVGLTAMGRTAVQVLNMTEERRVRLRGLLQRHE
jgi:hypothetical protein